MPTAFHRPRRNTEPTLADVKGPINKTLKTERAENAQQEEAKKWKPIPKETLDPLTGKPEPKPKPKPVPLTTVPEPPWGGPPHVPQTLHPEGPVVKPVDDGMSGTPPKLSKYQEQKILNDTSDEAALKFASSAGGGGAGG